MTTDNHIVLKGPSLAYLVVDDVAACRDFWVALLGFQVLVAESVGEALDFLLLEGPPVPGPEAPVLLEYQRRAGLSAAVREAVPLASRAVVYVWLAAGLDALKHLAEANASVRVVETRTAPYGADELVIRDPHGHVFIFGQRHASTPALD